MYIIQKNQHCIFILNIFICSKTDARSILCAGRPSLVEKTGPADDFPSDIFPVAPPEK